MIFAGIGMAGVGTVLFLPQILKSIGVSNTQAGAADRGALPVRHRGNRRHVAILSDKITDRYWTLVVTCGLATIGMVLAGDAA